jgi:tripartite-type tricarboxylate transporter receptor subunit TctC
MRVLVLLAALLSLVAGGAARADYPDKPVRIIVPFIAGSAPDVAARQAAQRLTIGLGQQFIVENKPGAAGNIGAEVAARAAPDGYTLMLMTTSHVQNKFLYARLNYDVQKDFVPVTMITRIPSLMVVPPSSPAKTVGEFIVLAKSRPGKLNYASGGFGSLAHLSAEGFRFAAGIDYIHVPYKGAHRHRHGAARPAGRRCLSHHADGLPTGPAGQPAGACRHQRQADARDARRYRPCSRRCPMASTSTPGLRSPRPPALPPTSSRGSMPPCARR